MTTPAYYKVPESAWMFRGAAAARLLALRIPGGHEIDIMQCLMKAWPRIVTQLILLCKDVLVMKRSSQGHYETVSTLGEKVHAYVPAPLPPVPAIDWTPALRGRFDQALLALGRLDSVSMLLPDVSLFLYAYVRKEAVLSSMIEGTQSSLSDLLLKCASYWVATCFQHPQILRKTLNC